MNRHDIKHYYQVTSFVNVMALLYSLHTWIQAEDFSFVQWPIVLWAIASNVSSIFVERVMADRTGVYVKVHSAIVFSFIWCLIGGLKLAYMRRRKHSC
jgi:hypothetical protein